MEHKLQDKKTRIWLLEGGVETLSYFSHQLAKAFEEMGYEICFWDMTRPLASREALESYPQKENCRLLTFNFIGVSGEAQFRVGEKNIWEANGIETTVIMVDHPMYYYKQLMELHEDWQLCCVDRDHCRFIQRFYPEYKKVDFLPLGGTELSSPETDEERREGEESFEEWNKRPISLLFAGNYVALSDLTPHIAHMDPESKAYYDMLIQEFIDQPNRTMEEVILSHLLEDFPDSPREDILPCMRSMSYIDLYVRSYFRRKRVTELAEAGIDVTIIGKDWEKAECKAPEHLHSLGQQDSLFCLQRMRESRISFNLMPWFKDGAHDRIFNAMLQGCCCLTDSSLYLDQILKDGENAALYQLSPSNLTEVTKGLLDNPEKAYAMARAGYQLAKGDHTWKKRGETLLALWGRG